MIDFKISVEKGTDGISYQKVRIYEGEVTTEDELMGFPPTLTPVTRYRRTKLLEEREYTYDNQTKVELDNFLKERTNDIASIKGDTVIDEQKDFSVIDAFKVEVNSESVK